MRAKGEPDRREGASSAWIAWLIGGSPSAAGKAVKEWLGRLKERLRFMNSAGSRPLLQMVIPIQASRRGRGWHGWHPLPADQPSGSGSLDAGEEVVDPVAESIRLLGQLLRRAQYLGGSGPGLAGCRGDAGDVGRDLAGPGGGLLDVAGDFAGGGTLLLD